MKKIKIATLVAVLLLSVTVLFSCGNNNSGENQFSYDFTNFDYSEGLTPNGYFSNIKALDYIELPEYKGLTVSADEFTVSADDIQYQIDEILASYEYYEAITDPTVLIADGDFINIDFIGYIDGVAFDGGSTDGLGTDVTIGVDSYIDDFLEQLIGHAPGENFDIEVTFPEDYGEETLQGKDAVFNITINHINGESIIPTELSDEIASDYGFNTVDELVADIEEFFKQEAEYYFVDSILWTAILKKDIPHSVLEHVVRCEISYFQYYADMYGTTLEDFIISYMGYTSIEAYVEENIDEYTEIAFYSLVIQAIAEKEGIETTDLQVSENGLDEYIDSYGMPYIKQYLMQTKVIPEFILANIIVE